MTDIYTKIHHLVLSAVSEMVDEQDPTALNQLIDILESLQDYAQEAKDEFEAY